MLKILAESFAVKGLCLEQQAKDSHLKKEIIIKNYIQAGEMGLKYLQVLAQRLRHLSSLKVIYKVDSIIVIFAE